MIEVEVKLPIGNPEEVKRKLQNLGFMAGSIEKETDTYFDNAAEEIRRGGQALRVRECRNLLTGETTAQINYKGQKLDQISMTRKELETEVSEADTIRQILQAIGFHIADPVVSKIRMIYPKAPVTACLDQVENLGDFLELEILADSQSQYEAAMNQIRQILGQLGYRVEDTIRKSYLSMLQGK